MKAKTKAKTPKTKTKTKTKPKAKPKTATRAKSRTKATVALRVRPIRINGGNSHDGDKTRVIQRELDVHRDELAAQNAELRRANAALVTAKERFAQLYDGAPIAYFTLDAHGTIVEANLSGAELLEASRNFLFGRSFDDVVVSSSRDAFRRFRRRVLEHGGRPTHETFVILGNRRLPVRIEAAPMSLASADDASGIVTVQQALLLCVTDETQRRRLDQERRSHEAQIAENHRVDSLGLLAGTVAHDFNNILAIVLANIDLIILRSDALTAEHNDVVNNGAAALSATAIESVAAIREAVRRAATLAKQMLAYTGRRHLKVASLDISNVIRSMSPLLESSIRMRIEDKSTPPRDFLQLDLGKDLPLVSCDRAQIEQIVVNLVVNAAESISAAKRTTAESKIVVRTRSESRPLPLPPPTAAAAARKSETDFEEEIPSSSVTETTETRAATPASRHDVVIEVTDDGYGMDEVTRNGLFDPLLAAKRSGRGLGLAVVHGNARAHGGHVVVESRPLGGTTFRVYLPSNADINDDAMAEA